MKHYELKHKRKYESCGKWLPKYPETLPLWQRTIFFFLTNQVCRLTGTFLWPPPMLCTLSHVEQSEPEADREQSRAELTLGN